MANEATVTITLSIRKANLTGPPERESFRADVAIGKGPSPGAITVTTDGTDVDLSELTEPGLTKFKNLDDTNFVRVGIHDPDSDLFYPFMKLLPGEAYVVRLADIGQEFQGTGTGTGGANNTLRIKADTADCIVQVNAYDS